TSECSDCVDPSSDSRGQAVQDNFLWNEDSSRYLQANTFQQPTSLHKQACSEVRWLVCNPLETGQVAVLDSQAFTLLERFHTPAVNAIIRSATKHGFKQIKLKYGGGEASLHLGRVLAIHDYATELAQQHRLGLSAYIISNGVVLAQRVVEQFKSRRIGITISLD